MDIGLKDKAADRLSTLRLINAAIKDKDIAARADEGDTGVGDAEVLAILGKMAKQRMESVRAYEEGGRLDLADREREEIAVIEEFLPRQLTEEETAKARRAFYTMLGYLQRAFEVKRSSVNSPFLVARV